MDQGRIEAVKPNGQHRDKEFKTFVEQNDLLKKYLERARKVEDRKLEMTRKARHLAEIEIRGQIQSSETKFLEKNRLTVRSLW